MTAQDIVEALFGAIAERDGLGAFPTNDLARDRLRVLTGSGLAGSEELLGAAYERSLGEPQRRAGGIHYTPRSLVLRVVERAFEAVQGEIRSVVDPAMGAGAFLCEALRSLARRASGAALADVARNHIFGIDRDPGAVLAARRALWLAVGDATLPLDAFDENLVCADALTASWSALFPQVPGGFDVVLGNPPFLGGKRIRTVHGDDYAEGLVRLHPGANKNVDLAAHFLRKGFDGLRDGGVLGFITTNTIAQGDTREGGIAAILRNGGTLFAADRALEWPGQAGVIASLLWLKKGAHEGPCALDDRPVPHIDAFFSEHRRRDDPTRLEAMKGRAFIGCFLRGTGFIFDDEKPGATRLSRMREILAQRPESAALVHPFLGGDEVMSDPEQRPHRFVIHFGERSLDEAKAHPELFAIVEAKVRPFREAKRSTKADDVHRAKWWQFANTRPELVKKIAGLERVIAIPRVAISICPAFLPASYVFSDQLVVVASSSPAVLGLLASRVHALWAGLLCSTLGMGLRYTPTDVFETFPIPHASFAELERDPALNEAGAEVDRERARVMRDGRLGLSTLARRVSRHPDDPLLVPYLDAQRRLDRAVRGAYGWTDDPSDEVIVRRLFALNDARSKRHPFV